MKLWFSILLLALFSQEAFSQGRYTTEMKRRDSILLDSICRKVPGGCSFFGDLVGPNSVFRNYQQQQLNPYNNFCFNRKIDYKATLNGRQVAACYFLNTETGYVGIPSGGSAGTCFYPSRQSANYEMELLSLNGESFLLSVDHQGKASLTELPSTDVSRNLQAQNFRLKNPQDLRRQPHPYLHLTDQNLPTLKYNIQGGSANSEFSLFVLPFRQVVPVTLYLGAFGTGYYRDAGGNTILSLALRSDRNNTIEISKISDVAECIDGSRFENNNELLDRVTREQNQRAEREIENRETSDEGTCPSARALTQLQREMNRKRTRATELVNRRGRRLTARELEEVARADDITDQIQEQIYRHQISLCNINRRRSEDESPRDYSRQISCHNSTISTLESLLRQCQAIDRGRQHPGQKKLQKARLYADNMSLIGRGCN